MGHLAKAPQRPGVEDQDVGTVHTMQAYQGTFPSVDCKTPKSRNWHSSLSDGSYHEEECHSSLSQTLFPVLDSLLQKPIVMGSASWYSGPCVSLEPQPRALPLTNQQKATNGMGRERYTGLGLLSCILLGLP